MSARLLRLCLIALFALSSGLSANAATSRKRAADWQDQAFRTFIASLWPLAETQGVHRDTFDRAFAGVAFDPKVVAQAKNQPEFSLPIWRYVGNAVSQARIERGRVAAAAGKPWLDKAQAAYHVDPATIVGIWGIESEFGAYPGTDSTIRSLASLAFVGFRGDYFRDELLAALVILQAGDIAPTDMKGSWAGAMGQTQFMPSNFLAYAVDFEGNGRRDIWNSPADAIGSTACYLAAHGWVRDLAWGFEVRLPAGFVLTDADSSQPAPFAAFRARGVERTDGEPLPANGEGRLLIVAGLKGPIFLVTSNFDVIKGYNPSTAYALSVALLGDAIVKGTRLKANWPIVDRPLAEAQVRRLQTRLKKLGYGVGEVDGKIGDTMRSAVRAYQVHHGLTPDGYANLELLKHVVAQR